MDLLERAQRNIYRGELNGYLEERQRRQKEEEYNEAFVKLDSDLAADNITQLRYDEIKNELAAMHEAEMGVPAEVGGMGFGS